MGIFSNRVTERTCRKVLSEVGRSRRLLAIATSRKTETAIQSCVFAAFSLVT